VTELLLTIPLVVACGAAAPAVETLPPPPPDAPVTAASAPPRASARDSKKEDELEALGFDAYVWGFAIVENYKAIYAYNVNTSGPEYKGPFNQLSSSARVYTPADKAIITPSPFYAVLRIYNPEPAAYDGSWKLPSLLATPAPTKPVSSP
jgi:hypothetical protein